MQHATRHTAVYVMCELLDGAWCICACICIRLYMAHATCTWAFQIIRTANRDGPYTHTHGPRKKQFPVPRGSGRAKLQLYIYRTKPPVQLASVLFSTCTCRSKLCGCALCM
jgi:hypothetical protein